MQNTGKLDHEPDLGGAWSNTASELMIQELTEISQSIRWSHQNKITAWHFWEGIPIRWMFVERCSKCSGNVRTIFSIFVNLASTTNLLVALLLPLVSSRHESLNFTAHVSLNLMVDAMDPIKTNKMNEKQTHPIPPWPPKPLLHLQFTSSILALTRGLIQPGADKTGPQVISTERRVPTQVLVSR